MSYFIKYQYLKDALRNQLYALLNAETNQAAVGCLDSIQINLRELGELNPSMKETMEMCDEWCNSLRIFETTRHDLCAAILNIIVYM